MSKILLGKFRKLERKKRVGILLFSTFMLIGLAGAAIFMFSGGGKANKETFLKIIPDNVDLQIKNFHYTEVGDVNWKWEINADAALYVKKNNLAHFDNVRIKMIKTDGKVFTISGEKGCLHTETKDAQISGKVTIVSNNGDRITTDRLDYSDSLKTVFTNDRIQLVNPRLELHGTGMTLFMNDERITLNSAVEAIYLR